MTLLGILFVLGIAFLASMNFEADMIVSESQRHRAESRVAAAVDQLGSTLRDGLMTDSRVPFGSPSVALSPTAYAELPGVQNSFSAVEPHWHPGPDGVWNTPDDLLLFSAYTDMEGLRKRPYAGPSLPQGFAIDTSLPNGGMMTQLPTGVPITGKCLGGVNKGASCDYVPGDCPGSVCEGPRVLDADGDGIVDSLQVDAKVLDFSDAQLAALAARLNPASNPTGKVYVGMRVLPHGGLVNLNASHPKLIENVLDVPNLTNDLPPGEYGNFRHRPTRDQVAYSPLLEERSVRRRGLLAPRSMPPSWLHGDPSLSPTTYPSGKADMQWQLFAPEYPDGAANGKYDSVFENAHRSWPFSPRELFKPALPDLGSLWAVRMEPFTSVGADPTGREYDRRHLVTTVSHDDLLARGGRVPNPNVPGGEEDVLAKMTQANQTAWLPAGEPCPVLLPFEYPDYPQTIANPPDANGTPCCPTDLACRLNPRKGRLQLSLPYLDDQIEAANMLTDPVKRNEALNRVVRMIHDTFFLLVQNAGRVTTLEGTHCVKRCLDGVNKGTTCNTNANCPGSICESLDCLYAGGACGANGKCTVAPVPPNSFIDCRPPTNSPCSIPGSVCRADGLCVIQAPYWRDVTCAECDADAGEVCNPTLDRCLDAWTGQTHSQTLISRTAAALTANLFDYADGDDVPTRIALRSLDLSTGLCISPPLNLGRACDMDANCGNGGICLPPRGMCVQGTNTGRACGNDDACGTGGLCNPPAKAAGREFDFDPGPTFKPEYVYGLERQPYITEVVTYAEQTLPNPPILTGWAVELFNPHDRPIDTNNQYYLVEVNGAGVVHEVALDAALQPNSGVTPNPFTVFITAIDPGARTRLLGPAFAGTPHDLTAPGALTFTNGSTIYLVRRVLFPLETIPTDIVVDQFEVPQEGNVGKDGTAQTADCTTGCVFSLQRVVHAPSPWTATVPKSVEIPVVASLGTWNDALDPTLYPVEVNFADLDWFSRPFNNPSNANDPRNGSVSFPTTGSLLMLMRHANRPFQDYTSPSGVPVRGLAFTTRLVDQKTVSDSAGNPVAAIIAEQQIDNGRMPVFDKPVLGTDNNWYAAHHLSPSVTQLGAPGNLDMLPWGQLVFDYFTALPLSSPGPYVDIEPGPGVTVALPDSLPRVDLDGLRVHGRINLNAAPWKVLTGLPFIPMQKIPVAFKARMRRTLGFVEPTAVDPLNPTSDELTVRDPEAARIGTELAQAIVAYRELRTIPSPTGPGTGNYANGTPTVPPTPPATAPVAYARGWDFAAPMSRRGTGFMSVGELANVRHLGAEAINPPLPNGFPKSYYRIDAGVIGESSLTFCASDADCTGGEVCDPMTPMCIRPQNYVDAVAGLVALGDWVTVRSQVFTVYGILRGEEDPTIIDPDPTAPPTLAELRIWDADSRALRFQETIDRLPTFLGEPVPRRVGDRSLTRYTDAHND